MSKTPYEQARADHEYLWSIGEAYDMTGGYVDSGDLKRMLETPTKAMATRCYERQISHWFDRGPDLGAEPGSCSSCHWINTDPKVREIAERYGAA